MAVSKMGRQILLVSILGISLTSGARAEPAGEDSSFQYGGPCSQLARLSALQLSTMTHPAHSEQFVRLCTPENVYTCADYSQLLEGYGTLEENGNLGCRFVPGLP